MAKYASNANGLTEIEQKICDYMDDYRKLHGYFPAVREIMAAMGLKSTSTIQYHLKSLEEKGWVRRNPAKSRALELLNGKDAADNKVIRVPIVGDVAAGIPILAEQHIDGYFPLPKEDYGGKNVYMLRVHGDSMINIGIYDGDQVIVEQCETAENGEIVVALVDDSATVKRFFKEHGHYRLQPENDAMEPILVDHVEIQGIVIGLVRKMPRFSRW